MALKKIKKGNDAIVFLFNPKEIDKTEIIKALIESGEDKKTITLHPDKSSNESTKKLMEPKIAA